MNENELSDAMRRSLPPRPNAKGWADGARRKARTRRVAVAAAAVVAVTALAVPLVTQLSGDPRDIVASPAPTTAPPEPAAPWIPEACGMTGAEPLVDGDLPADAARLWLCGAPASDSYPIAFVGASEPLEGERVAEALDSFNALARSEGVLDCMGGFHLPFTAVAEYPDGTLRGVRMGGCGELVDAVDYTGGFREGGDAYLATLEKLWAAQRDDKATTWDGIDVSCTGTTQSLWSEVDPARLTRALACVDGKPVELPADITDDMLASVATDLTSDGRQPLIFGAPEFVLLTAAGDPVALLRWGDGLAWHHDSAYRTWTMPEALRQRIDDFLAQLPAPTAQPTVDPTSAPLPEEPLEGLLPQVCADVVGGVLSPDTLAPTDILPGGVQRAWFCGDPRGFGGVGPVEPLTTQPDRIVEAINGLPVSTADACTEVGGPTYHVVLDYADGERRVIAMETVNCQFVAGTREGGGQLVDDVLTLWQAQREATPQPFTDEVALCSPYDENGYAPRLDSVLPVQRAELTRGVACGLPEGTEGLDVAPREVALPPELVLAMGQSQLAPLDPLQPSHAGWPTGLPVLIMLNQFGDPLSGNVGPNAAAVTFINEVTGEQGVWTPTEAERAQLLEVLATMRTDG
ncbi:hypothetical protein H5392_03175 [Tessaracoccus sp. MC1865]|uniref:hypothetical protein n=1 Tax=Tessaracoccus sp. MC1865 TaxID=2760310 RepID=UPI00160190E8|nr:hypothetical protein [Tessaracoccus sp. MC1865]MBB1482862.1 hypothetical protein [Tessaracoccus sp. MC1865]QTO37701.1 hypothetical protein J7D54_00915 [Tessaracoccus sp. MC1865]